MTKPRILLTYALTPEITAQLHEKYDVLNLFEAEDENTFLHEHGPSVRAVVTGGHIGWPAPFADRTPNIELVAINGVGFDKVDLAQARARGFRVTNTPDLMADDVADLAIGLIISFFRRIPEGNLYARDGRWLTGDMPLGRKVSGRRFGIFGMGRIGRTVAERLRAFSSEIAYYNRSPLDLSFRRHNSLRELAAWSDVLVVTAAATPETHHVVDREVLRALGPDALLVNVARGALVNEAALIEALAEGSVGGAALDVFETEPRLSQELLSAERTVMMPHVGSATVETRHEMGLLVLANVEAHFAGRPLPTPVV